MSVLSCFLPTTISLTNLQLLSVWEEKIAWFYPQFFVLFDEVLLVHTFYYWLNWHHDSTTFNYNNSELMMEKKTKKNFYSQFLEFITWMSFLRALHSLYNLILTSLSLRLPISVKTRSQPFLENMRVWLKIHHLIMIPLFFQFNLINLAKFS